MDLKRQRAIWIGAGLFFVVAVGSGYIPDLMLAHEMAGAKEEGLLQAKPKPSVEDSSKNAYRAYDQALRRNFEALSQLSANPAREWAHPSSDVRKLYTAFAEASTKTIYFVPELNKRVSSTDLVTPNLKTVAMGMATSGRNEEEIEAAARVANHLRQRDPAEVPSPAWAKIAERVLDRATTLKLSAEERRSVVAALGASIDLKNQLRGHVVAVLQRLDEQARLGRSRRMTSGKIRFLRFWREFLRTVPTEPKAFAAAVAAAESKIEQADNGVGIYRDYTNPSPTPWQDWAMATAKVIERLRAEGNVVP